VERLSAIVAVQRHAVAGGLAAAEPIAGPAPMGLGLAVAERALDVGRRPNLLDRRDRAAAARGWVALSESLDGAQSVIASTSADADAERVVGGLYPVPHSPLFDFDATSDGAAWIDDLATEAARTMERTTGPLAVVHTDWRSDNIRVDSEGTRIAAIFDWESVRLSTECNALGLVAAMHSVDWFDPAGPYFATGDECVGFAREVERARSAPFSPDAWAAVRAAIVYGWCYTARCEHARAAVGDDKEQFGMRRRLASDGRALLDAAGT
jgi:Phosphotransferase enzyme family